MSVGQFDELGFKTQIENGIMKIIKGALVVMKKDKISSKLLMLQGDTLKHGESSAPSTHQEESTIMWHQKLGHMSKHGLKILIERNLLLGLKVRKIYCQE